jgi:hypothetical protein
MAHRHPGDRVTLGSASLRSRVRDAFAPPAPLRVKGSDTHIECRR